MKPLRKVKASETIFNETKLRYSKIFEKFKQYAQKLSDESGKAEHSNKAPSYAATLIKLIVLYEEIFNTNFGTLNSFEDLSKFREIQSISNFKDFNTNSSHFYSATINCFIGYLVFLNSEYEEIEDEAFESNLIYDNAINDALPSPLIEPKRRENKLLIRKGSHYPRNAIENLNAKVSNNWLCIVDSSHKTFTSAANSKPYVEAHHLIPMAAQDNHSNTLDFANNIVTLCPNCHRKIHHACVDEKKGMIVNLFNKRKNIYKKHGIEITQKQLLSYYGIL
ncbi:HNH endonuclease [Enterococcus rotai]|uniref:HNH endonuclease n=1 Tax=Enterococcus rotai TaxID=118060 RepID=UPI0035C6ECD9